MSDLLTPIEEGDLRLEPLAEGHRDVLRAACAEDRDIWPIYAVSYDPDHFDESFARLIGNPARQAFAVLLNGRLVGMSAYIGAEPERGVVEIGNTYFVPAVRGSGINRHVKSLMLDHAFAKGYRRVEFRVDARNTRSQAAVLKLGATREGVIRAERVTWTGHVRDTVLFSILADEWPALRGR